MCAFVRAGVIAAVAASPNAAAITTFARILVVGYRRRSPRPSRIFTRATPAATMYALRTIARRAAHSAAPQTRAFASASKDSIDAFMTKFAQHAPPKFDAPSTPTTFMPAAAAAEATSGTPEKLKLNFYMPHAAPHDGEEVRWRACDAFYAAHGARSLWWIASAAIDRAFARGDASGNVRRERSVCVYTCDL